jgi:long-chain acyl-CoA synthetase
MALMRDWFRRNAKRYPDKTAVVFEDVRLTFKQINERVNSAANGLSKMGIKKGARIALLSENCHQCLELWGVASKSGTILVPLNYRLNPKEIEYQVRNAGASTIFFQQRYTDVINYFKTRLKSLKNYFPIEPMRGWKCYEDLVAEFSCEEPGTKIEDDDLLLLLYTSGTTGLPKGAMITNKNVFANATSVVIGWGIRHEDINVITFPLYSTGGIVIPATACIYMGCTNVIMRRWDAKDFLEKVQKEKCTTTVLSPTMLILLLQYGHFDKYDIHSLRTLLYGGSSMHVEPLKRAVHAFGNILMQGYGLTESTGNVALLTKEDHKTQGTEIEIRRLASCGKEHSNHEVDVFGTDGGRVKVGEVGEIVVRGDTVMKGYWKMPEATGETIRDGWLFTGDLATIDEDGYIYVVDRSKDMIISGSANIYPREIEEVIYKHPAVSMVAVIGVPDEVWGESVKAFIVLKEGKSATEEEIIDLCKSYLASYKKPKYVEFVESLPTDSQGKVLKREIRRRYLVHLANAGVDS